MHSTHIRHFSADEYRHPFVLQPHPTSDIVEEGDKEWAVPSTTTTAAIHDNTHNDKRHARIFIDFY
jgi:hypothetical protein